MVRQTLPSRRSNHIPGGPACARSALSTPASVGEAELLPGNVPPIADFVAGATRPPALRAGDLQGAPAAHAARKFVERAHKGRRRWRPIRRLEGRKIIDMAACRVGPDVAGRVRPFLAEETGEVRQGGIRAANIQAGVRTMSFTLILLSPVRGRGGGEQGVCRALSVTPLFLNLSLPGGREDSRGRHDQVA